MERGDCMRVWLDDLRDMPCGFDVHAHSVNEAIQSIILAESKKEDIEIIDCDHDLGDYYSDGGDGIKLLDWLVERETFYPIKLHTANPVGRANMQRMLERYWNRERG